VIPRLRRWLRPPRVLRPTRAGWIFFAITFGVGFAALNTGNNLLYLVLSLMLGFLTLSGVLSESALRGIEVRRRLPRELYAGEDNPVLLEIGNRLKRVPAFAIVVEDLMFEAEQRSHRPDKAPAVGRTFALRVGPRQSETRRYAFRPACRGRIEFAGYRVSTRFPFGLFLKFRTLEDFEQAVVFPEVAPLRTPTPIGAAVDAGGGSTTDAGLGCDVSGLRGFEPGDSLRRVHWKSSLRRGSLLVAQVEDEREAQLEVYLRTATQPPSQHPTARQSFEHRVQRAASEVVHHLAEGLDVALRTDSERLPFGHGDRHRRRLLSFLALVAPSHAPTSTAGAARGGSLAA
jgi:uncharacterized protein (DUF58 family)